MDDASEPETMSLDAFEVVQAEVPEDGRWELIDGCSVRATMGEPWEHACIVRNIARLLGNAFEARTWFGHVFTETFYLKSHALASAMLPDVLVVSGDLEPGATSVDDAKVLFEVLSPGTEARDRFEKWRVYQQLASLQHYVLVTRDPPRVETFDRTDGTLTGYRALDGLDATLDLSAIGASLTLRDIYRRVIGD